MAKQIDTVTVEVVRNLLMSIAEETYGIIVRSAYSTNMKERRDVCTAVIDPDGNSVAQVESLAALLGSMLSVVPNIYEKFGKENVQPGDMYIANDPYHGGGNHLPDIVIAAPAFVGDKLVGWIANIAHHSDIGGKVPGSTSGDADSLFQEGIRIPVIRIRQNGKLIPSVMDLLLDNTRVPQEREGDLTAQMSANLIGVQRIQEAYARYQDDLIECMKELVGYSERRVRAVVAELPDGEYSYTDYVDGCGDKYPDPLPIKVKITIKGDDLTIDFTGTAEQIKAPINVPYPCTKAAVFFSIKALMGDDIPANEGINRAIKIIAPKLPISSTGHMILVDEIIHLDVSEAYREVFMVVIQLGAILAVMVLYFNKLNPFSPHKSMAQKRGTIRLWIKIIIACIPAAVIGLPLDHFMDKLMNGYVVAAMLILYGVLFIVLENRNVHRHFPIERVTQISFQTAALIGCFQVLAMIPGTSRSGATILGAMLIGCSRPAAAEFSFFLGIPVMFGASFLKIVKFFIQGGGFSFAEFIYLVLGMVVAFGVSVYSIKFLMGYVRKHDFKFFGYYRIVLGIVVLSYFGISALVG